MQQIPLLALANQSFTVELESKQFTITLKEANGCMVADVNIDGADIVLGSRCLAGEPIIPFAYLQDGNLVFQTLDDALPDFNEFGVTQTLFYLTDAEMA